MQGYFGSNYFASWFFASDYFRKIVAPPPVPTPTTVQSAAIGLLERSGREGGFLVPPGFPIPVFGRFSKEVSDPWFGRNNPYALTAKQKEEKEAEELAELMELVDLLA